MNLPSVLFFSSSLFSLQNLHLGYWVEDFLFMEVRWVGNIPELLSPCLWRILFFGGCFIYCMYRGSVKEGKIVISIETQ
jgi:hypothetical protein